MASPIQKMVNYIQDHPKKTAALLLVGLSAATLYWLFTPAFLAFSITAVTDLASICLPTFISYSLINAAVNTLAYVGIVGFFAKLTNTAINFVTRMTSDTPATEIKGTSIAPQTDEPHAVDASRGQVHPDPIDRTAVRDRTDELSFQTNCKA